MASSLASGGQACDYLPSLWESTEFSQEIPTNRLPTVMGHYGRAGGKGWSWLRNQLRMVPRRMETRNKKAETARIPKKCRKCFPLVPASIIKHIPISSSSFCEVIIWETSQFDKWNTNNQQNSVKRTLSAYRLLLSETGYNIERESEMHWTQWKLLHAVRKSFSNYVIPTSAGEYRAAHFRFTICTS